MQGGTSETKMHFYHEVAFWERNMKPPSSGMSGVVFVDGVGWDKEQLKWVGGCCGQP